MISPRQYATEIGKAYTTVMSWLQSDLIPEAVKVETPTGHVYSIPQGTKPPAIRMGRPKKAADEGAAEKPKPAKKARKSGN